MEHTFEERITDKIDTLYQGCLFLRGGDAKGAEHLLVSSATRAFEEHTPDIGDAQFDRWLETRVVTSFLEAVEGGSERSPSAPPHGSYDLHSVAGRVPALSRAALWLVLLRRWDYKGAAEALGVDRVRLIELLQHRSALVGILQDQGHLGITRGTGSLG
jgi:hypothetical protein